MKFPPSFPHWGVSRIEHYFKINEMNAKVGVEGRVVWQLSSMVLRMTPAVFEVEGRELWVQTLNKLDPAVRDNVARFTN